MVVKRRQTCLLLSLSWPFAIFACIHQLLHLLLFSFLLARRFATFSFIVVAPFFFLLHLLLLLLFSSLASVIAATLTLYSFCAQLRVMSVLYVQCILRLSHALCVCALVFFYFFLFLGSCAARDFPFLILHFRLRMTLTLKMDMSYRINIRSNRIQNCNCIQMILKKYDTIWIERNVMKRGK